MNSLMSYGSDDDSNDSGDQRFPEMPGRQTVSGSKNYRKPAAHEDNYEEVGMDMSEDSDDSSGPPTKNREEPRHNVKQDRQNRQTFDKKSNFPQSSGHGSSYAQQSERRSGSKSPKNKREEDERRNSRPEDRGREDRYRSEDKYRRREERVSRDSKDDDRSRDKSVRDEDKGKERERRDDRKDSRRYSRDQRDRDRKRSRSRDNRRRSRSPRRSPRSPRRSSRSPRRVSRSPRRASRSPRRSRSGSRDKGSKPYLSRREKADKRMDRLDKLGIQFKPDNYPASAIQDAEIQSSTGGNRFFMPGITGRFREQIEKRKQLWQKAKEPDVAGPSASTSTVAPAAGGSKATKVYEATTFSDDKTSNKFKRLMGIKGTDTETLLVKATDVLKKQQEMFSSMEAQYEVARTATHTMRGVGLGFGSFQR